MRQESIDLQCPASQTAGPSVPCGGKVNKYFQVWGTFVATISIEGRLRGGATPSPWVVIASVTGASGPTSVPQPYAELRCNVTAYTSGSPSVVLGADDSRAE